MFALLALGLTCTGAGLLTDFRSGRRTIAVVVSLLLSATVLTAILTTSQDTVTHERVEILDDQH